MLRCRSGSVAVALTLLLVVASSGDARAQTPPPKVTLSVNVDASHATRDILHIHETIPVSAGALTLEYPKWIPGEHMPSGPIVNVAGLVITAGATPLRWLRDLVDANAFHIEIPPGTSSIDVRFDYLGAAVGRYSSARLASANMFALNWNKVLITPHADDYRTVAIAPTLTLPGPDWHYATALDTLKRDGATIAFGAVTMEQLIDSPLVSGTNFERIPLGSIDGAPVDIAIVADSPEQLDPAKVVPKLKNLVAQMGALYRARHFDHYTFLLTASDILPENGVEHHQSSDNGTAANFLIDANATTADADLLAHEFNHSWDGKFRRPFDLATPNLNVPMRDDLLWVYEGMTQFYGNLLATRAGLLTPEQYRDKLAATYAMLDSETGRLTTPLYDTAAEAPELYDSPGAFRSARRGTDFYSEGELMWLEADVLVRKLSSGKRSIDDFARAFFGRTSTGPLVVPYTRDDVIAALNGVQPYDWANFFRKHIDAIAPHPPDPFTGSGWKVAFAAQPSALAKIVQRVRKGFDARFSLGIVGADKGMVADVVDGSPAQKAGLAPGDEIVAINSRETGHTASLQDAIDAALVVAQHGGPSIKLLVRGGGTYRELTVPYTAGPKYPVLEAIPGAPDVLDAISKPLPL
jgi:predicted metalloprotease with PDZ domain